MGGDWPETAIEEITGDVNERDFAGVLRIHFLIQERQAASRRRMLQGRQEIEPC